MYLMQLLLLACMQSYDCFQTAVLALPLGTNKYWFCHVKHDSLVCMVQIVDLQS